MKITSKFLRLNWFDFGKGLIVSAGSAAVTAIQNCITAGAIDWKTIGSIALASGVAYLIKNLLTPAQIITPVDSTTK